jgi:hypothetical protein
MKIIVREECENGKEALWLPAICAGEQGREGKERRFENTKKHPAPSAGT